MEIGGRWSEEAHCFLEMLAMGGARDAPQALRGSVYQACMKRWSVLIVVAGMRSFADTLVNMNGVGEIYEGGCPTVGQLLEADPRT